MKEKEKIYEEFTRTLKPIADRLDDDGRFELDGILWAYAVRVSGNDAGAGLANFQYSILNATEFHHCAIGSNTHVFRPGNPDCQCGLRSWPAPTEVTTNAH